jgi:hypothetical protein
MGVSLLHLVISSLPGQSAKRVFEPDDPAIHPLLMKKMDARVEPAHDELR